MLNDGNQLTVIDVREHEFDAGCFEDLHLSKGVIERDIEKHPISEEIGSCYIVEAGSVLHLQLNHLHEWAMRTSTHSGVVGEVSLLLDSQLQINRL